MKIVKSKTISAFGGLNFVLEEFDHLDLGSSLTSKLPALPKQSLYSWRDILYSFWSIYLCGGDCIEDLSQNLNNSLKSHPKLSCPSPDSVLRRFRELASVAPTFGTPKGKRQHKLCWNDNLNRLNINIFKRLNAVGNKPLTLDFDNTIVFTQKEDAMMTYKKQFGYTPGVGIIDNQVVYVENRNGNADPQTLHNKTLENMFELFKKERISVDTFRADGASFQLKAIDLISQNCRRFFVRGRMSPKMVEAIKTVENWEPIMIDDEQVWRGSTIFIPFQSAAVRAKEQHLLKPYRMVVTKVPRKDGQINIFTGEAVNYYPIVTNDTELSNDQVVFFYNQRGAVEKEFDVLKNDFGWSKMPFSKIEENTVFLIFTAMCRNLYHHLIRKFSKLSPRLKPHFRIKKFIFRFICIPAKWIFQGRSWKLRVYGELAYSP